MLSALESWASRLGFENLLNAAVIGLRWRNDLRQFLSVDEQLDFGSVKHFTLDQRLGNSFQRVAIVRDDLFYSRIACVNQLADFLINFDRGVLAVVAVLCNFAAKEYLLFFL